MVLGSFDFITATGTSDRECVRVCESECVKIDAEERESKNEYEKSLS